MDKTFKAVVLVVYLLWLPALEVLSAPVGGVSGLIDVCQINISQTNTAASRRIDLLKHMITETCNAINKTQVVMDTLSSKILLTHEEIKLAKEEVGFPKAPATVNGAVDAAQDTITLKQNLADMAYFFASSDQIDELVEHRGSELKNAARAIKNLLCAVNDVLMLENNATNVALPANFAPAQTDEKYLLKRGYALMYSANFYMQSIYRDCERRLTQTSVIDDSMGKNIEAQKQSKCW